MSIKVELQCILIFITFRVPIIPRGVASTSDHYFKQLPVNVQLTGLMCAPKIKYIMHTKVETEEY